MIIVKLIGGLGNQLFQYAFGRYLANKYNTELKLDITGFDTYKLHDYSLMHFNIKAEIASNEEVLTYTCDYQNNFSQLFCRINRRLNGLSYLKEPHFHFHEQGLSYPNNTLIEGYWQCEKYFSQIKSVIMEDLMLSTLLSNASKVFETKMTKVNSVSIHIRRGDYVNNTETNSLHGTCSIDYYLKGIELIQKEVEFPIFFVFSDDIPFAKKTFGHFPEIQFVDHNTAKTNYEDLYLMSKCKHNIIANSSFSWWGAWLNQNNSKIVIAPDRWFNTNEMDYKDIYAKNWMVI